VLLARAAICVETSRGDGTENKTGTNRRLPKRTPIRRKGESFF